MFLRGTKLDWTQVAPVREASVEVPVVSVVTSLRDVAIGVQGGQEVDLRGLASQR